MGKYQISRKILTKLIIQRLNIIDRPDLILNGTHVKPAKRFIHIKDYFYSTSTRLCMKEATLCCICACNISSPASISPLSSRAKSGNWSFYINQNLPTLHQPMKVLVNGSKSLASYSASDGLELLVGSESSLPFRLLMIVEIERWHRAQPPYLSKETWKTGWIRASFGSFNL